MSQKTFCVLEQGNLVNEPATIKKKEMFTTEFSDFYRLNWAFDNDPNANFSAFGVTWSEGRSLLYERVPKIYDYYLFIDDDVNFHADLDVDIPQKVKELLEEYNPLAATFYDPIQWGFTKTGPSVEEFLERRCFPIAGYDAESQIYSKSYADVIFPFIYHGAHRTDWYTQWVCYRTFPTKQMGFSEIRVSNSRSGGHSTKKKKQQYEPTEAVFLFNQNVKNKNSIFKTRDCLIRSNIEVFDKEVDKRYIEFTLEHLSEVYNINNLDFKLRKAQSNDLYLFLKILNRFQWKVIRKLTGEYRY
jgi:hypothetical protein